MSDASIEAPGSVEPWTLRQVWRDYWRVLVIGLLAAIVAFVGSFIVAPTYTASTRVLIRAKDTTLLNSTGQALGSQPGVVDSQIAAALSDTQGALVSNREVATRVVDRLGLDKMQDDKNGIIAKARRVFASTYKCTRAILTFGFCRSVDKRTAKIDMVQGGLGAKQIEDGYAMDVAAAWDDPEIAADIANTAADILVEMSNERFQSEAETYRDFLADQNDEAVVAEQAARDALATYKADNGITTTPEQDSMLIANSREDIEADIRTTQADLQAARAEAASLRSQLSGVSPFVESNQEITTGRSTTNIDNNAINPQYSTLLAAAQQAEANAQSLDARLSALQGAIGTADAGQAGILSEQEAKLASLQLDVQIASQTRQQLSSELETASVNAQRPAVEVSRIDAAAAPTYPVAPKRYLYLGIGLALGALLGFVWSFLRVQRHLRATAPAAGGPSGDGEGVEDELPAVDLTAATRVEARAGNGTGNGAGNGARQDTMSEGRADQH